MRTRTTWWFGVLSVFVLLGGVLATPARAGERDDELALRAVQAQIEQLMQEARRLREAGDVDRADDAQARATDLKRRVFELRELRERLPAEREKAASRKADDKRRKAIARGLAQGIEALRALGRHEEAAHLARIQKEVLDASKREPAKQHEGRSEREMVANWIELMGYAVKVLAEADRHELAQVVEHGRHALELALAGKRDEVSMKIREGQPPKAQQAEGLRVAGKLLRAKGDAHHAELMQELAERWLKQAKAKAGAEHDAEKQVNLDELPQRVEILQMALPALREGGRKDAVEILERAIHSGKILLAEREDEEARQILERTPPLQQLARVLTTASELWMKFGHETKARLVASLAQRYAQQAREAEREEEGEEGEREEAEEHEHGEREKAGEHEHPGRAEDLQRMQRQIEEVRAALERIQRQLRALTK